MSSVYLSHGEKHAPERRERTMSTDNIQSKNQPMAIDDSDLNEVAGGMDVYHDTKNNKYYKWYGGKNCSQKYRCPNCGGPVHRGIMSLVGFDLGDRYFCDPCDEQWFFEKKLTLNVGDGLWEEISFEQWVQENGGHGTH